MGESRQVMIYSDRLTARFSYIVMVLFGDNLLLTTSQEDFLSFSGVTINYSAEKLGNDSIWIVPHGLLDQQGISEQAISFSEWKRMKIFFQTKGELPFDIFSASFYLISRYEEYLPHERDEYGRFPYMISLAFREGFLHLPLVNLWMQRFEQYISGRFPYVPFKLMQPGFRYVPTYDIDIAFSYRDQPLWKNVLGFFKGLLSGNFESVTERSYVYSGQKKDPFDIYDWLDKLHIKHTLTPVYFFLLAEKRKGNDKNVSPHTKSMRQLIKRHAEKYATGIHPSWQSGDDEKKLKREISLLKKTGKKEVTVSRQHYIRMCLPATYRKLIVEGIKEDHSMGYGGINGFRASYTLPYKWYDLSAEEQTGLELHPFCFMDSNSIFQQREHAYEAAKEVQDYLAMIRSVNGEMVTIFHNHFLAEQEEWREWRDMYAQFLSLVNE